MSTTKHTSFIPMSPELLPRQKLNEVVTVPELPKGLAPKVEWVEPLLRDPPRASPRKLTFLFSVEWMITFAIRARPCATCAFLCERGLWL